MNWLFYATLAPALYATINFIDKYLLSKILKDYNVLPIYTAIAGFITGTFLWFIFGLPLLTFNNGVIVILTGIITAWSLLMYARALSKEDASNVIIYFQFFPIFTFLFGFLLLKETLTGFKLVGFISVFIAGLVLSYRPNKNKGGSHFSKTFLFIILYDIMWALSGILMRYVSQTNSFVSIVSYESWGVGIGGMMIYYLVPTVRRAFQKNAKKINSRSLVIIFLNEGTFVLAKTMTFYAISLAPVAALVSALENTQTFYGIVFGYFLTKINPRVFKENITRKGLLKKIFASITAFIGVLLITH